MENRQSIDHKFLNIESRVAVFIFFAVVGTVAVWLLIAKQQHMFSAKKSVYFITESGKNLQQGVRVTFSGFRIGKINSVSLNDDDKVLVELSINSDYIKRIKKDSTATMTKELPIGESVIEIMPGSKESESIKENEYITFIKARWFPAGKDEINTIPISFANSPEMLDIIAKVKHGFKNDIEPIINDFKFTLQNFRTVSEDALVTRKYLDTMYLNADKNLNALDTLMTKLNKEIPEIIIKANDSLDSLKIMAEDIRDVTIKAFADITRVIDQGSKLTDDAMEITDAVKTVWPISSKIKKNAKLKAKEEVEKEETTKEETEHNTETDK